MRKKYVAPVINTYDQKALMSMIEAGACSNNFECHCHSGGANTGEE